MKNYLPGIACLILGLTLTTCATEDLVLPTVEEDLSTSVFNLKEETLVIDDDTNQDLRMFDVNSGLMIYEVGSPQLDSITVGGIILSRPTAEAPGGFLRKVTAVEQNGSRLTLETEPANLPDAFESYRWVLGGENSGRGRDGAQDPLFTFGEEPIMWGDTFDVAGVPDWEFVLGIEMDYTLEFRSALDYNLSLLPQNAQVERMNMGLNNFSINALTLTMKFIRGNENTLEGNFPEGSSFNLEEEGPSFNNIAILTLPRFPIDPPSSLVWVEPQIRIDISEVTESMVQIGNRFVFGHEGVFKGLIKKDNAAGGFYTEFETPSALTVSGGVFFEGSYKYSSGLSIGLGVAPYSRNLFTLGCRTTVGPYAEISGNAGLLLSSADDLVVDAGASLEAGINTSAGLFLDADFFGLARDDWDIEQTLWSSDYAVLNAGVDAGCGQYFNRTFSNFVREVDVDDVDNDGNITETLDLIKFSATKATSGTADVTGTYDMYLNNQLLGGPYEADGTVYSVVRPSWVADGTNQLRFFRASGNSILPCEKIFDIEIVSFGTSEFCVDGVALVVDEASDVSYCVREFGGQRWLTSNLLTLLPAAARPTCPDGNPATCEAYGGLYAHQQATDITAGPFPAQVRGICPEGYHLPSRAEWRALFADFTATTEPDGSEVFLGAAVPFKARSTWGQEDTFDPESSNRFDALGAGWQGPGDALPSQFGEETIFWTSEVAPSLNDNEAAWGVLMRANSSDVVIAPFPRSLQASCRCVAD